MRTTRGRTGIASLLSVMLIWATAALPEGAPPIKVGCLYPLTGLDGLYGRDSVAAIQIAQDVLKAHPLGDMPQLEILVEDTRSKPLRSLQIARDFVHHDEVDFLCGVVSPNIAEHVSTLAMQTQTFFIGTEHATRNGREVVKNPFYFRMNNDLNISMSAGARYIAKTFSDHDAPLRIAFIGPDLEYSYQSWEKLRDQLNKIGVAFDIAGEFWPKPYETDFRPVLQPLLDSNADIVVSTQWGLDLVTFIRQADKAGLFDQAQFMNFESGGNFDVLAELGVEMPLGLVLSARHHLNWPETSNNEEFVWRFYNLEGRYPSHAAEGAYSGILAIATAIRLAGGVTDIDAVKAAMGTLRLSLPEDPEGFQSFMDPATNQLQQVQAIGRTVGNSRFPPAAVELGDWSIYYPD